MRTVWSALHPDKSWRKIRVWTDCLPRDQKEHARSLNIGKRRLRGSPHLQRCSSGTNCAVGMTWQNSNIISGSGAWALTPNDQCRVRLCRDDASLSRGSGRMRRERGCASKACSGTVVLSRYSCRAVSWEGSLLCDGRMTGLSWMSRSANSFILPKLLFCY